MVISYQCFQGKGPYYPFPHLRVKLQRDPKDRSVSGKEQYTLVRFAPLTLLQALRRQRRGFKDACITGERDTVLHALDFIDPDAY